MFIDEVDIQVNSGKGGNGIVHFRKEKFINRGGPDGGDGGKGGKIIFEVNEHLNTLENFRHKSIFKAQEGKRGGPNNRRGKSGDDLIIQIPPGTVIYEGVQKSKLADLTIDGQTAVICKGGRGGRGNKRFANSRTQAPRIAEKGEPGEEKELHLELKLIADVGIIGMPNAGKSSLLAAITNAKPKIANYPFTTLVPNLGVVTVDDDNTFVMADIPGLIEGAHTGLGLGDQFLRHIQRTKILIHLIDGLSNDPVADFSQINSELTLFDPNLTDKEQIVIINKIDLPQVEEDQERITNQFRKFGVQVQFISALARINLDDVLWKSVNLLSEYSKKAKEEIDEENLPVYHPESREKQFTLHQNDDGWVIKGAAIERAAAMTYWEYFASIRRFHRILEAMGIADELRINGIREGDTVKIGDHELTWAQELAEE
jgi:GTP-binding protein